MHVSLALSLPCLASLSLSASFSPAAAIPYSFAFPITQIGPFKAPLPGMENARIGDHVILQFTFNTPAANSCQAPNFGCYYGSVTNIRFRIPRIGYVYTGQSADLSVLNYTAGPGMDTIRVEAVLPGLNANFLFWLRSNNPSALTSHAVPTSINISDFDWTQYAGFYGTTAPTSNILAGAPVLASPCPADLNADEQVDDADFTIFLRAYNVLDCFEPGTVFGCPSDFNSDGVVDDADFVTFIKAYDAFACD